MRKMHSLEGISEQVHNRLPSLAVLSLCYTTKPIQNSKRKKKKSRFWLKIPRQQEY